MILGFISNENVFNNDQGLPISALALFWLNISIWAWHYWSKYLRPRLFNKLDISEVNTCTLYFEFRGKVIYICCIIIFVHRHIDTCFALSLINYVHLCNSYNHYQETNPLSFIKLPLNLYKCLMDIWYFVKVQILNLTGSHLNRNFFSLIMCDRIVRVVCCDCWLLSYGYTVPVWHTAFKWQYTS